MTPKEAANLAMSYAADMMGDSVADIRLEEIDRGGTNWNITLSWVTGVPMGLTAAVYATKPREYKVFSIHGDTRELLAMRIRKL